MVGAWLGPQHKAVGRRAGSSSCGWGLVGATAQGRGAQSRKLVVWLGPGWGHSTRPWGAEQEARAREVKAGGEGPQDARARSRDRGGGGEGPHTYHCCHRTTCAMSTCSS